MNNKYADFFNKTAKKYKEYLLMKQRCVISRLNELSNFSLEKMESCETNIMTDLLALEKQASPEILDELGKNFNEDTFINGFGKYLGDASSPKITIEEIFKDKTATRIKKHLFSENSIVMEVEVTSFYNPWYPKTVSDIILDLLSELVSADKYKKITEQQTPITGFARNR